MATTIVMPQMGYDMREGTVVKWYKNEGEQVDRGEIIADIQTDKATVEFEAYVGGVLGKIYAAEGVAIPAPCADCSNNCCKCRRRQCRFRHCAIRHTRVRQSWAATLRQHGPLHDLFRSPSTGHRIGDCSRSF